MEERIAKIEGILEQMNARLNHLESDIAGLRIADESIRAEIRELRAEIRAIEERLRGEIKTVEERLRAEVKTLSEKIDRNFRWTLAIVLGILIPMWVTIILAIILA